MNRHWSSEGPCDLRSRLRSKRVPESATERAIVFSSGNLTKMVARAAAGGLSSELEGDGHCESMWLPGVYGDIPRCEAVEIVRTDDDETTQSAFQKISKNYEIKIKIRNQSSRTRKPIRVDARVEINWRHCFQRCCFEIDREPATD